jgi:hypothetical protein
MSEDVHGRTAFTRGDRPDQIDTMRADPAAMLRIFGGNVARGLERDGDLLGWALRRGDSSYLTINSPTEIHRSRSCLPKTLGSARKRLFPRTCVRRFQRRQIHSKTRGRADQASAANMHVADRIGHLRDGRDVFNDERVRQRALIDDLDDALVVGPEPDRLVMLAADFHVKFCAISPPPRQIRKG